MSSFFHRFRPHPHGGRTMSETEPTRGREKYTVHPLFPWAVMSDVDYALRAGFPCPLDGRWLTPEERARARRRHEQEIAELDKASTGSGPGSHFRRTYIESLGSVSRFPMEVYAGMRSCVSLSARALLRAPSRLAGGLARLARTASMAHGHGPGSH